MANEIFQKLEEIGGVVAEHQKTNDERLEKIEKGQQSRAKELDVTVDKLNQKLDSAYAELKSLKDAKAKDEARIEILEALADRPKGTPEERLDSKEVQTWGKFLRSGLQDMGLANELKQIREQKMAILTKTDSVQSGSALLGQNAVPAVISATIEKLMLATSDILPAVNLVTNGTVNWNELVTIPGAAAAWSSETGSRSQSGSPNLRKVTPTNGELYAFPRASNWSLEDLIFDVVAWLQEDVADNMGIAVSTAIWGGSGSSQPTGMTHSAPTSGDDSASPKRAAAVFEYLATADSPITTAITADNLIDLQFLLRRAYQSNAQWALNSVTMGAVRKLKDSYGQYLWQPNFQAGTPLTILGKPVLIWEDVDSQGANKLPVVYGDFRRAYTLTKIGGMTMIRDQVTVPGFTNFLVAQRYGGIPRNNDAAKFLKQSAS